jgi:tetratricopeptide (TPR) repeat protein
LHRTSNLADLRRAIEAFRSAIALDPSYAAAYAKLALSTAFLADQIGDTQGIEEAAADADKAVALAPDEAAGYSARGYIRANWKWDWEAARADFETAVALDANDSSVLINYAGLLASIGRLPDAIAAAQRAVAVDPMSHISWQNLGKFLLSVRENAAAAKALHRALEIQPHNAYSLMQLGTVELLDGNFTDALATFSSVGFDGYRQVGIAMAEHSLGRAGKSQRALDEAIAKGAQGFAYQIAGAYAWNGDRDKAFEWLDRAYMQRDGGLADMKFDPLFDSARGDPRYRAFLRKMGLPE